MRQDVFTLLKFKGTPQSFPNLENIFVLFSESNYTQALEYKPWSLVFVSSYTHYPS